MSFATVDAANQSVRQQRLLSCLQCEARDVVQREPLLSALLQRRLFEPADFEGVLTATLASVLAEDELPVEALKACFAALYPQHAELAEYAALDLEAVCERDPAINDHVSVVLWHKGFQALQTHRLAHVLWQQQRRELAHHLNYRASRLFGVDIHPACSVGHGVMFDHATGIVVGETAEVGHNVSIMQGVTLGGTGKERGERHPKVRSGVLIGAGATVLGNIEIGFGAQVGAGSVVLQPVAAHTTAVGVPARETGRPRCPSPSVTMEHGCSSAEQTPARHNQDG
ncbi:serine O-acetyltransferase [Kushneria aurantia]|uniref:Serine acetyltransferase n=1 Tax=Kushneria aurantia TaxID=504092 RepID=A0ABV6G6B6_9GAMM|nr:serine O-acetyltransferase [Kushneria aurantia]